MPCLSLLSIPSLSTSMPPPKCRDWVNAALANDIGNLLNRSLSLLKKNCDSKFPLDASALPADSPLCEMAAEIAAQVRAWTSTSVGGFNSARGTCSSQEELAQR